jgi:hypothetical protein
MEIMNKIIEDIEDKKDILRYIEKKIDKETILIRIRSLNELELVLKKIKEKIGYGGLIYKYYEDKTIITLRREIEEGEDK